MKKFIVFIAVLVLAGCDQSDDQQSLAKQANAHEDTQTTQAAPKKPKNKHIPDFASFSDVKAKKKAFFNFLLPLIYRANQSILEERKLVEQWLTKPNSLKSKEEKQIQSILVKYRVVDENPDVQKNQLLNRVNIVPPSLVLSQAANESAWGTSRFALEGNNLFGQWCYEIGCGIIPGERNHRAKHEVRVFKSPYDSVVSYMRNLNSHPQYQDLRAIRASLIQEDEVVSGTELAEGLIGYSERRELYVEEIQEMIRQNRLSTLDQDPLGLNTQDIE